MVRGEDPSGGEEGEGNVSRMRVRGRRGGGAGRRSEGGGVKKEGGVRSTIKGTWQWRNEGNDAKDGEVSGREGMEEEVVE